MVDMAHIAGLVAAGVHPSPVPHADFVTTTTHKTLRGPRGGLILCREQSRQGHRRARLPRHPGRAADAHHRRQGGVLRGGGRAGVRRLPAADRRQRHARWPAALADAGFRLVSGGTDNHLMLVDVCSKGLTGKVAEAALGKAGITVNKNTIPFDTNPPMVTSGIRIGTPAVTTRGMGEPRDGPHRPTSIARVLAAPDDDAAAAAVQDRGRRRCAGRSRSTRKPSVSSTRSARAFADDGPLGARAAGSSSRRDGQRRMAEAVARTFDGGGVLLAEAGTGTGKTLAYLVPASPQRTARARLDRHQEPPGTDLLQGRAGDSRRARHPLHGDRHEGPRQLSVPAPLRGVPLAPGCRRTPHRAGRRGVSAGHRTLGADDRAPATAPNWRNCPRNSPSGTRSSATADTCLGSDCPRHAECFVTRMRQTRRRDRRRHRQPPPAVRRRRRAPERLRRGDPVVSAAGRRRSASARRRRHAVLRPRREQPAHRRSGARRRSGTAGGRRAREPQRRTRPRAA